MNNHKLPNYTIFTAFCGFTGLCRGFCGTGLRCFCGIGVNFFGAY